MSKFWQKKYISKYTGAEIDAAVEKAGDLSKVEANPTLAGTEAALTGLEVGETKYKVKQPINVAANPTLAGTEAALEGLQVGDTKYKVDQPVVVVECTATVDSQNSVLRIVSNNTLPKSIVFNESKILVFSIPVDDLAPLIPISIFNAYTVYKSETGDTLLAIYISMDGISIQILNFTLSYDDDEVTFRSTIQLS